MDRILIFFRLCYQGGWRLILAVTAAGSALLLLHLPLLDALLFFGILAVALGNLKDPLVGIGSALFLGPLWAWLRADWPQVDPLLGQYVFLMAVLIWGMRGLAFRDLHVSVPPLLTPLVVFMGVALLSLWSSTDATAGFLEFVKWVQILLVFVLVYDRCAVDSGGRCVAMVLALLAGIAFFQSSAGIWQFAFRGDGPDHFAINEHFYRAYGTFEQPNPFGGFLGMSAALMAGPFFVAVSEALQHRSKVPTWGWAAGIALLGIGAGLLASWSRGAWMGFAAAMVAIAGLLPRRPAWQIGALLVVIVGGFTLYSLHLLPASLMVRMTGFLDYVSFEDVRGAPINSVNYAVLERMAHWQAALGMWQENFWLGVGFGCYEPAYPDYRLINWPIALGHAHNYYLNLLAETGLIGLAAYMGFLGAFLVALWKVSRSLNGWQRGVALGVFGALTHFAVHSLVDNLLVNNVHLHFGVLLALAAWLVRVAGSESKSLTDKTVRL